MVSSTNERGNVAKRKRSERERIDDELVIKDLMSSTIGRGWVWRRISEARLFDEDMHFDPGYMAYRKGERNWALRLLKDAQGFTPREYVIMTEENANVKLITEPLEPEEMTYE